MISMRVAVSCLVQQIYIVSAMKLTLLLAAHRQSGKHLNNGLLTLKILLHFCSRREYHILCSPASFNGIVILANSHSSNVSRPAEGALARSSEGINQKERIARG